MEKTKNCWVIPTDKPSRLIKSIDKGNLYLSKLVVCGSKWENQEIYITSDEDIKDGDWYYDLDLNKLHQYIHSIGVTFNALKKIILTTDADLIKDGVQSIPDEFLEWFVNNPSCEEVEVEKYHWFYIIMIPKEEETKCYCGHTTTCDCGPEETKQETLEEVAERKFENIGDRNKLNRFVWLKGGKRQKERSYSDEEVNKMFDTLKRNSIDNVATISNVDLFISSWKDKFKKK